MTNVIDIAGLVKIFGSTRALDGMDLTVRQGEVHGFLGPNGAGKTTTLRVLVGLLKPDGGAVRLLDGDPWQNATALHRRIAYVPGDVVLWPNLTGGEIIDVLGRFHGGLNPARRAELATTFELDLRKKAGSYSKGNRQKVGLIAALASDAEMLILDEPTAGLDPLMEAAFKEQVHRAKAQGASVLLSSHILSEVEQLCDRVSIIRAGRNVESGTLDELRHLTSSRVTVELASAPPGLLDPTGLAGIPGVSHVFAEDSKVSFHVESPQLNQVMTLLTSLGLQSLVVQPPTLEELFLSHYRTDRSTGGAVP